MHHDINKDGILAEPELMQTHRTLNALSLFVGSYAKFPTVASAAALVNADQYQMFEWSTIKAINQRKDHFEIIHTTIQFYS